MAKNQPNTISQEIYCHNCGGYVKFDIDLNLNGNHVLYCPNCKHEHCRVVKDGVITGDRWDSRNGYTYSITCITYRSNYAATYSYKCGSIYTELWLNTTSSK